MVIWDKDANGRYSFDDVPIRKPDPGGLSNGDLIIVLIRDLKAAEEVYDLFDGDNRENFLPYAELLDYLGDCEFEYPGQR
jgi:hypothetical protein